MKTRAEYIADRLIAKAIVDDQTAAYLRDCWDERVAICTIDGGLDLAAAEAVADKALRDSIAGIQAKGAGHA